MILWSSLLFYFFIFLYVYYYYYFTILYCHTSTCIHHGCTRVPHPDFPWDFPGKRTGVGCHCLLQLRNRKAKSFAPDDLSNRWHNGTETLVNWFWKLYSAQQTFSVASQIINILALETWQSLSQLNSAVVAQKHPHVKECMCLCSNKTLFIQTRIGPDSFHGL